jgi:hypothetical protein
MTDVHVVPSNGSWAVEAGDEKRESFDTQAEAIEAARELAEQEQGELVVHGEDGEIRDKTSHGNDPRDIAG